MDIFKLLRKRKGLRRLGHYWRARAEQEALRSGFDTRCTDTMRMARRVLACKRMSAHYFALATLCERALHSLSAQQRELLIAYAVRGLGLRQMAALHARSMSSMQMVLRRTAEAYRKALDALLAERSPDLRPIATALSEHDRWMLYDRAACLTHKVGHTEPSLR